MIRRLGKRWQKLHRLIYVAGICGVIHYWWLVKADIRLPALYAALLAILLGARVVTWATSRTPKPRVAAQITAAD
jgi:sulfoxide reductase heme-binding subunit YedZ